MVKTSLSLPALLKAASLSALLAGALTTASLVQAESPTGDRESAGVKVSFAELDLEKEAGVDALYSRLQRAAEQVCGMDAGSSYAITVQTVLNRQACYTDALDRAVTSLNVPSLTAKHAG
ncbi:MAG: UrcA family protein [Pseudomonadota bacterium]